MNEVLSKSLCSNGNGVLGGLFSCYFSNANACPIFFVNKTRCYIKLGEIQNRHPSVWSNLDRSEDRAVSHGVCFYLVKNTAEMFRLFFFFEIS